MHKQQNIITTLLYVDKSNSLKDMLGTNAWKLYLKRWTIHASTIVILNNSLNTPPICKSSNYFQ